MENPNNIHNTERYSKGKGRAPIRHAPIELAKLAMAPLGQSNMLPALSGVYLAVDAANRVWYVGLADSIRDRVAVHDRLPNFREKGVTSIAWQSEADDARRRQLEKELIEYFHPPLNLQHNFNQWPDSDLGLSADEEIERFLRLRIQLKLIELELETLRPNIVTRCDQSGGKIAHGFGTIYCTTFKSWQFSEEVDLLKLKLQRLQKEEKENGRATVKSEKMSPVARLNGSALASELAIRLSPLLESEMAEPVEEDEISEAS